MYRLIVILVAALCCSAQSRNDWRLSVQYGTTVPSSCEGGEIFIKTDATAGSNTYACVSGTYVAQGGGTTPGLVLVEQKTASSSASLNFTTCISSTYDRYLITFSKLVPATNSVDPYFRVSTNGGSSYVATASYRWWNFGYSSGGSGVGGSTGQTQIKLNGGTTVSNGTNYGFTGELYLTSPGGSGFKQVHGRFTYNGSDGLETHGTYDAATAVNAFQILFSSGNIASGTIRCYGMAK